MAHHGSVSAVCRNSCRWQPLSAAGTAAATEEVQQQLLVVEAAVEYLAQQL